MERIKRNFHEQNSINNASKNINALYKQSFSVKIEQLFDKNINKSRDNLIQFAYALRQDQTCF